MKEKAIITTDYDTGQYVKSDRTSTYPICIRSEKDGKLYWVKPADINSVMLSAGKITGEKFCSLLRFARD